MAAPRSGNHLGRILAHLGPRALHVHLGMDQAAMVQHLVQCAEDPPDASASMVSSVGKHVLATKPGARHRDVAPSRLAAQGST